MFGCVAGILGAALVVKMIVRARRCRGGGCGGGGGRWHRHFSDDHGGPYGRGRGWGGSDAPWGDDGAPILLRGVFERLRTTPGQERVIVESLRTLKAAMRKAAEQGRKAANAVGDAMKSDELSTEKMGDAYAHLDDAAEALRSASFDALSQIHGALDETQRKILADFLKRPRGLEDLADGA